jgi:hypothetical protein
MTGGGREIVGSPGKGDHDKTKVNYTGDFLSKAKPGRGEGWGEGRSHILRRSSNRSVLADLVDRSALWLHFRSAIAATSDRRFGSRLTRHIQDRDDHRITAVGDRGYWPPEIWIGLALQILSR